MSIFPLTKVRSVLSFPNKNRCPHFFLQALHRGWSGSHAMLPRFSPHIYSNHDRVSTHSYIQYGAGDWLMPKIESDRREQLPRFPYDKCFQLLRDLSPFSIIFFGLYPPWKQFFPVCKMRFSLSGNSDSGQIRMPRECGPRRIQSPA